MPRVLAFIPDLLFGSRVISALTAAGHEVVLAAEAEALDRELPGVDLLIADLTDDVDRRLELIERLGTEGVSTLAFYAHVEAEVRERAAEAGFDLIVPRSRMAREGPALVGRLLAGR